MCRPLARSRQAGAGASVSVGEGGASHLFGTDINVDETIQRVLRFLRNCTNEDGELKYMALIREVRPFHGLAQISMD